MPMTNEFRLDETIEGTHELNIRLIAVNANLSVYLGAMLSDLRLRQIKLYRYTKSMDIYLRYKSESNTRLLAEIHAEMQMIDSRLNEQFSYLYEKVRQEVVALKDIASLDQEILGEKQIDGEDNRFMNNFVETANSIRDVICLLHLLYLKHSDAVPKEMPSSNANVFYETHLGTGSPTIYQRYQLFKRWLDSIPTWRPLEQYESDKVASKYTEFVAAYARGDSPIKSFINEHLPHVTWLNEMLDEEGWQYEREGVYLIVQLPQLKID